MAPDGDADALADIVGCRLDSVETGQRAVEFAGEAGTIVLHELEFGFQIAAPPFGFQPP